MDQPCPAYVVGAPTSFRDRVAESLDPEARVLLDAPGGLPGEGRSPGVVLLLADHVEGDAVLALLDRLATGTGEWTPCLVREEEGEMVVRSLSVGWRESLDDVSAFRRGDGDRLLELRRIVGRMARSRHDINNPLTSGMAETQLRRIRDLVADTRGVRAGSD